LVDDAEEAERRVIDLLVYLKKDMKEIPRIFKDMNRKKALGLTSYLNRSHSDASRWWGKS
jgi:hypothetical protein